MKHMLIVQNILAFAIGPLNIGMARDAMLPSYGPESLRYALAVMLAAPVVAALLLWRAQRAIATG